MANIFELPNNFIGKEDRERLESFGGHEISRGRSSRWHWSKDEEDNDQFEIYGGLYGGNRNERCLLTIARDRVHDRFIAHGGHGEEIVSGALDHVMALVDNHLAMMHGEPEN